MDNKKYAFGFVLDSITLEPANAKFEKDFVDPEIRKKEKVSYSLITIKGIGCYIDIQVKGSIVFERSS